jgi:hypothetical protein
MPGRASQAAFVDLPAYGLASKYPVGACVTGNAVVRLRPSLRTVQAIEANLLPSAIARTLRCNASEQLQSTD